MAMTIAVIGSCRKGKDVSRLLDGAFRMAQQTYSGCELRVAVYCNEPLAEQARAAAARREWEMDPDCPPGLWDAVVSFRPDSNHRKLMEDFKKKYQHFGDQIPLFQY